MGYTDHFALCDQVIQAFLLRFVKIIDLFFLII
jgi:hypothetical protein